MTHLLSWGANVSCTLTVSASMIQDLVVIPGKIDLRKCLYNAFASSLVPWRLSFPPFCIYNRSAEVCVCIDLFCVCGLHSNCVTAVPSIVKAMGH